ncbi:MAG: hypothetical protein ACYDBB_00890 [Armatimonadota bacterium]
MEASLVIAIYYYDGYFYLPTCVRSVDGLTGMAEPIVVVPADDRSALAEEIELKAIAGNPALSRADFRATSDNKLLAVMRLPNRQAFFTRTQRWSIVEDGGVYTLFPFKPAAFRGVVEDVEHAVMLSAAAFAAEAAERTNGQIG